MSTTGAEQRLVQYYRKTVGQCAKDFSTDLATFHPPALSSRFIQDDKGLKALPEHRKRSPRYRLLTLNLEQVYHKIANIGDHMRALQAVFALDPPSAFAPSSMARVVVEAAAGVHALLDASISTEERILRGSSLLLESYWYNHDAAKGLSSRYPHAGPQTRRQLDRLVSLAGRAGLEVPTQANGKPKQIRWSGDLRFRSIPFEPKSELAAKAFPGLPALYEMGSGVAHSMEWMLGDHARIGAEGLPVLSYVSNPYANGAAAIAVISAAEVVITQYGRYMGFDPEEVLVRYRRRREALDRYMNQYAGERLLTSGSL